MPKWRGRDFRWQCERAEIVEKLYKAYSGFHMSGLLSVEKVLCQNSQF